MPDYALQNMTHGGDQTHTNMKKHPLEIINEQNQFDWDQINALFALFAVGFCTGIFASIVAYIILNA